MKQKLKEKEIRQDNRIDRIKKKGEVEDECSITNNQCSIFNEKKKNKYHH